MRRELFATSFFIADGSYCYVICSFFKKLFRFGVGFLLVGRSAVILIDSALILSEKLVTVSSVILGYDYFTILCIS